MLSRKRSIRRRVRRSIKHCDDSPRPVAAIHASALGAASGCDSAFLRRRMVVEWNQTHANYPRHLCLHQLFERQAEKTPNAVAGTCGSASLTYDQLNRRANRLAHHLRTLGVGPDVLVALCLDRSLEMVVAMLAILKAGGAYVPLDPAYPAQRRALMLADAGAPVLLTRQRLIETLPPHGAKIVCIDRDAADIASGPDHNPLTPVAPHNLSYVIYTSGSTGRPKGVMLEHRNAVSFVSWCNTYFTPEEIAVTAAITSISFDISIIEIFVPLTTGARFVLLDDPLCLSATAVDLGITLISSVPSVLTTVLDSQGIPPTIRGLILGGEPLAQPLVERIYTETKVQRVFDVYGPTETTTFSCAFVRTPGGFHSYGKPIANTQIYILDECLQPVPPGTVGEVYIAGDGVARGYFHQPELTQKKFIPNPFLDEMPPGVNPPGERLYRTGDLARYREDGNIEPAGRIDDQIKIRGFRVELGEIEAVLLQHPGVSMAAANACGEGAQRRLIGYIVTRAGIMAPDAVQLRSFLQERLPAYMVPASFVFLTALPLTPSGKLDRRALPAPDAEPIAARPDHLPPLSKIELGLTQIFQELIGIERVGVRDDFFDIGGNSLLAARVTTRARRDLNIDISLPAIFELRTAAALAQSVNSQTSVPADSAIPAIPPADSTRPLPLSFAQQRLWFLDRFSSNKAVYNIQLAVDITGRLHVPRLLKSLDLLLQRHAPLRTRFVVADGEPFQEIEPNPQWTVTQTDLVALPPEQRRAAAEKLAREEADRPFDLSVAPLVRATLLRLSDRAHVLLMCVHHIVSDGWSVGVLLDDLQAIYLALENGDSAAMPAPLAVQYADYCQWQRAWMTEELLKDQLAYWGQHLQGAPPILELPTDRPRPPAQSFRGSAERVVISQRLTEAVKELARRQDVTLFMTLLGAFQALLARYTGRTDIVVGSPIAGRHRGDVEKLVGLFVNTLALRTDLSGDPTAQQLLGRVRDVALGAFAHQDVPFEKVVDHLRPHRSSAYSPLIQVMFVLQNTPESHALLSNLTMRPRNVTSSTSKVDLTLSLNETGGALEGHLEYSLDLFDAATIRDILAHFQQLLEGMVADPARPISRIPLLTGKERRRILVDWNKTRRPYPRDLTLHALFEQRVSQTPGAIAIIAGSTRLTYEQLNIRANKLAHYLRAIGICRGTSVGICTDRSPDMIVAILATLKAGGVYVPLDPTIPAQRLCLMLEDTGAPLVLTHQHLVARLSSVPAKLLCLDSDWPQVENRPSTNLAAESAADDLAYIIYTSGTTGTPNGVEVRHRGVLRLVCNTDYATFGPDRTFLQLAPISFDASTFEIWGALLHGARCVIYPDAVPTAAELGRVLRANSVTTLWLTASLYNALIRDNPEIFLGLSELLIGGEALNPRHIAHGLAVLPNTRFINGYGPTECTTFACCHSIPRNVDPQTPFVPIGRPIANTQVYILDSTMEPVPVGVTGELYIGGDGLARGYLNRPQQTAERFVTNPFAPSSASPSKLYRTGDMARWRTDGTIECLGRLDHQVKIRGFRVELGEIEAALNRHPAVAQSAVSALRNANGDLRLAAYIVPCSLATAPSADALRAFLSESLPHYMVPAAFAVLAVLPLTTAGKIDRRALAPFDVTAAPRPVYAEPRNATEEILVAVFQDLLNIDRVGIHDDFFDLGGHSLLALRLSSRIESSLGALVPLATILSAPTVAGLAANLAHQCALTTSGPLVRLQPHGTRPPLFFLPGLGGHVLSFRELARHLGTDHPVFGLQPSGLDGQLPPHATIKEMAVHFIDAIRQVCPNGPYYLVGFSAGGITAYEMAQQLNAHGQRVDLLALLDTWGPGYPRVAPLSARLKMHIKEISRRGTREAAGYLADRFRAVGRRISGPKSHPWSISPTAENITLRPYIEQVSRTWQAALSTYVPKPYNGRVDIFRAIDTPDWLGSDFNDVTCGWGSLALGGIAVHNVPGDHLQIIRPPGVEALAAALRQYLHEIQAAQFTNSD